MYTAALRILPNDQISLLNRSIAHTLKEPPDLDKALSDADSLTSAWPDLWKGWLQKGEILKLFGSYDKARSALEKADKLSNGREINVRTALMALQKTSPQVSFSLVRDRYGMEQGVENISFPLCSKLILSPLYSKPVSFLICLEPISILEILYTPTSLSFNGNP